MHLKGAEGTEFELRIVGYEFTVNTGCDSDANWLNVVATLRTREGDWKRTGPWMSVADAHALSAWIWRLCQGEPADQELELTEPDVCFAWAKSGTDVITIRVRMMEQPVATSAQRCADLTVDHAELRRASRLLEAQFRDYPPRARPGQR